LISETYTLREAARLLGVSLPTLRRRVVRGEIPAVMTPGPFGERWEICRDLVFNLLETGEAGQVKRVKSPSEAGEAPQDESDEVGEAPQMKWLKPPESGEALQDGTYEASEAPSAKWAEAGRAKRVKPPEAGEALQDGTYEVGEAPSVKWLEAGRTTQDGPLMKALEMLQEQGEEVRRLERQGVALQYELSSYRRALAESAESLAERDALRKQIESESLRAESQALENAKLREIFEAEKASLTEEVRLSKSRVDWLEKRVPRWVRSLFRAG
jgi:excisionase family DNA binding protein